jgi:uroporphyrinogen-III decarboxylase
MAGACWLHHLNCLVHGKKNCKRFKDSFYASPQTVENIFNKKAEMAKEIAQMQAQLAHHLQNDNSSSGAPMPDDPATSENSVKY